MSKLRKSFLAALALSIILLSGCAGDSADKMAEDDFESAAVSGAPAEEGSSAGEEPSTEPIIFEGTDMEGNAVSADVFSQSKLTMLNVWATYCGPCLNEMPSLGELAAEYDTKDFQIIGIVSDVMEGEDQALVESLIQRTGANYTHLLLNESIYYALLTDVSAVPTTFFLDEDGLVLGYVLGAREKSVWEEIINGLLEEL